MEFKLLLSFVAVAEELHFSRAAERLHISQPPLSRQIALLEEELGTPLFARTSRKVKLTPEGAAFLEEAKAILARTESAAELVRAMARGEAGTLRLGFAGAAMEGRLPDIIRAFRERYTQVALSLHEAGTAKQLQALRQDHSGSPVRLDAGFVFTAGRELPGLTTRPFMREPMILALPESHPLSKYETLPLHVLAGEPLIMFPRQSQPELHDEIMSSLRSAGGEPHVAQEAGGGPARVALAAAGLGLALVPASMRRYQREGVAYLGIEEGMPALAIALAWREDDKNPVLKNFLDVVKEKSVPPT
jgi:DNA-binding transcriptional LysR family regulator